ncbi:MAG: DNA-binding domain-containing protein, partial [Gammaproteobacteria bacterium]|nr:DNA-binding domain-containing protein [Gammaproteobacteria bacterium]
MNKLRALQSSFLSDVMRDDATDSHYIQDSEKLPAAQRLQLYQEAYVLRLQEALTDSFPILEKYLGSEQFAVIAEQFIKSHPSRHFSIREFGDEFASFISATANSDEYLFLAELAAFEWALGRAFDGIDATPLQRSQLETVAIDAWPQLKFSFLPGFTKLKFSFNAPLIWKALSENQALPEIKQY